jgi:hypothetical protein
VGGGRGRYGRSVVTAPHLRTILIGAAALTVWFAMLWFMFGDVL